MTTLPPPTQPAGTVTLTVLPEQALTCEEAQNLVTWLQQRLDGMAQRQQGEREDLGLVVHEGGGRLEFQGGGAALVTVFDWLHAVAEGLNRRLPIHACIYHLH